MNPLPCSMQSLVFSFFLLWHRSVRAAWLLLHTLDKMLWAKGQFFMLQHIHYFLAGIFPNTINSRLYLEILSEPHLSHKQKLFSKSQFSQIFTTLQPEPILLWGYWSLQVNTLSDFSLWKLTANSKTTLLCPKGQFQREGKRSVFPLKNVVRIVCCVQTVISCVILISRRSLADRPRVHIGVSPFYAWSINSGSKTRRTSTITSTEVSTPARKLGGTQIHQQRVQNTPTRRKYCRTLEYLKVLENTPSGRKGRVLSHTRFHWEAFCLSLSYNRSPAFFSVCQAHHLWLWGSIPSVYIQI